MLAEEVPALVARGVRSLKVFLTDDPLKLSDGQFLDVLACARRNVRLSSFNAAALFGLGGRKGTLAPGADADLVLWDPDAERTIANADLHHAIDCTPWEDFAVKGWPVTTIRRGEVAVRDGAVLAKPGSGQHLARGPSGVARPRGIVPKGFDAAARPSQA